MAERCGRGAAAHQAIERAYREEWTPLLATLAGQVGGDIGLAEEAVAEAFAAAAAEWPEQRRARLGPAAGSRPSPVDGPSTPSAATAPAAANQAALEHLERLVRDDQTTPRPTTHGHDRSGVADDRLRLLFTCCHPALAMDARVALTLRAVGGLEVAEVARALLTTETTMYQRLVRAKRKIKAAGSPTGCRPTTSCPSGSAGCCT